MSLQLEAGPMFAAPGSMYRPMSHDETSAVLFNAFTPLHGLSARDANLLERSVAGRRFILAMHPFASAERALMRVALADLAENEAIMVEAAASFVADIPFEDDSAWNLLDAHDRRRTIWYVAIQRLAEGLDDVCHGDPGAIHVAWACGMLHLEVDGCALSQFEIDRVLGRSAAIEAVTGMRLLITSVARRGVA